MIDTVKQFIASVKIDVSRGENIDAYIAILLGIVFTALDIVGITDFEILGPIILLTLTLVIFGSLSDRKALERLGSIIQGNESKGIIFRKFEFPDSERPEYFRTAQITSVVGISLFRFVPMFHHYLEQSLSNGGVLRLLLVDPSSNAMNMVAMRSTEKDALQKETKKITDTIEFVQQMKRRNPKANIQLRIIDYLPPYVITVVQKTNIADSWCQARLLTYRTSAFESPTIVPDPIVDREWFDFFLNQFNQMFDSAKIVELENEKQSAG